MTGPAPDDVASFLDACRSVLGGRHVVTDPDVVAGHATDWTGAWRGATLAVLRPGSTDDVAAVVRAARAHHVPLVPQGGNTGLVGGSVPHHGEVVVDLRRLDQVGPVDGSAGQVTAGAGVTLRVLQDHVAPHGLAFGVDLAARDSATVGGMVATNAGGLHVLRHGAMRAQLLGVTAVLGTGEVVVANPTGLVKDNTGYDLAGLLCGSEGTLGIVTDARLRLVPAPVARVVALLGFAGAAEATAAVPALRRLPSIHALEVMAGDGLRHVAAHLGAPLPLAPRPGWVVLVELARADADPAGVATDALLGQLSRALDALGAAVVATAVAEDEPGAERLWRWRDAHSEAAARLGIVHKADVTLPLGEMAAFLDRVPRVVEAAWPGAVTFRYGHLGDGNVHVNVVGPPAEEHGVLDGVLDAVLAAGGSVSAEHGIGVAKLPWLERQRGRAAVDAMRAIKHALDPDGVLNPGVLLPEARQ